MLLLCKWVPKICVIIQCWDNVYVTIYTVYTAIRYTFLSYHINIFFVWKYQYSGMVKKIPKCILRISVLGSISKCDAHFFTALCIKWNTTASLSWSPPKMKCPPDWKVFNLKPNYEALEYWQILWNAFKVHHSQLRNIKILKAWK